MKNSYIESIQHISEKRQKEFYQQNMAAIYSTANEREQNKSIITSQSDLVNLNDKASVRSEEVEARTFRGNTGHMPILPQVKD